MPVNPDVFTGGGRCGRRSGNCIRKGRRSSMLKDITIGQYFPGDQPSSTGMDPRHEDHLHGRSISCMLFAGRQPAGYWQLPPWFILVLLRDFRQFPCKMMLEEHQAGDYAHRAFTARAQHALYRRRDASVPVGLLSRSPMQGVCHCHCDGGAHHLSHRRHLPADLYHLAHRPHRRHLERLMEPAGQAPCAGA